MRSVESRMANMAVVCAVIVALSHVGYNTSVGSVGWWFVRLTCCGICCLAVPFFFMVSGYFLSRHFDESGWWHRESRKRLVSLVVPYLVWSLAFFLFARIGSAAMHAAAGKGFWVALRFPVAKLPHVLGVRLDATPMLVPLWYVRALVFIVLLSPALAWISRRKFAPLAAAVFFGLYVAFGPHRNGLSSTPTEHFLYYGFSLMGIAYFFLGILARKTRFLEKTLDLSPWVGLVPLAAAAALLVWRVHRLEVVGAEPFPILCLAIPFLVGGLWLVLPAAAWPRGLTSLSFPIYVLHFFVVYAMDGFRVCRTDKSIALMALHTLCAIAIPCVAAVIMRRFTPCAAKFLFGGR